MFTAEGAVRLHRYLVRRSCLATLTTSLFRVTDYVTLTEASPLLTSPAALSPLVAGFLTRARDKGIFLRRAPATEPGALRGWRRRRLRLSQRVGVTVVTSLVGRYRCGDDVPRPRCWDISDVVGGAAIARGCGFLHR